MCVLGCFTLRLSYRDSLGFLNLGGYFLPHFREVFTIISSTIFSWPFILSSSSGTPMIRMLGHLIFSWRSLRLSSFLLIHFSFFLSDSFISTILSSTSLILSSASRVLFYYLLPPESFDLIYCIIHYILTLFYFF